MTWTLEEIDRDWLAGGRIAHEARDIVAAFDRCERMLGREWIDRAHCGGVQGANGRATGTAPTLTVIFMGLSLGSLDAIPESQRLVDKIREGDSSAIAELRAIHLLRSAGSTQVELEPTVTVVERIRKPDFRIRRHAQPWIYVEVTRPDTSDAQAEIQRVLQSICDQVVSIEKPFALEVFFRREPAGDELAAVLASVIAICTAEHAVTTAVKAEMPNGLGLLNLNQQPAGQVVLDDHGEKSVPRLGSARAIIGPGAPDRHVAVRMPYADQRAERFLTTEARQLPTDAPGLIMVEMAKVPGGFQSWDPILRRRFQPAMHTRVGGAGLFTSGLLPTDRGEAVLYETKLVTNAHANIPLPSWIGETLQQFHKEYETLTRRPAQMGADDLAPATPILSA